MSFPKKYDVLTICNALVDIIYKADELELKQFKLRKGEMNLVESEKQISILRHFAGRETTVELGGSSLNAMRALAMLHRKTVFAGMLAHDHYGALIRKRLEELRIRDQSHYTDKDATGTCVVLVTEDGERTMNTHLGASRLYTQDIIPVEDLKETKIFHFSGYQWDTDEQKHTIKETLKQAKAFDCQISFDVADPFVVQNNTKDFINVIEEYADIVFANQEESKLLFNTDPQETAKRIAATGATAVIKLGAQGSFIQKGNEAHRISAPLCEVVDTTGAGDMFAAGFLFGHLSNLGLEKSGNIATYLATDVISRYGAHLSQEAVDFVLRHYGSPR